MIKISEIIFVKLILRLRMPCILNEYRCCTSSGDKINDLILSVFYFKTQ